MWFQRGGSGWGLGGGMPRRVRTLSGTKARRVALDAVRVAATGEAAKRRHRVEDGQDRESAPPGDGGAAVDEGCG